MDTMTTDVFDMDTIRRYRQRMDNLTVQACLVRTGG